MDQDSNEGSYGDFFDNNLGFLIGKTHRYLRKQWQSLLSPLQITTAQGSVLSIVKYNPNISLREASRALEIDVMAVSRVLQTLVERGLVEVEISSSDSRKYSYRVTEQGNLIASKVESLAISQKKRLEALIGPQGVKQMSEHLEKIISERPGSKT